MKYILLEFSVFFLCNITYSQKTFHGIGPHTSFTQHKKVTNVFFGVTYSLRINVYEQKDFSVSLGAPFFAGASLIDIPISIGGSMGMDDEGLGDNYSVSIPLIVSLNWGAGSGKSLSKKAGYFVGAGMGYLFDGASIDEQSGEVISSIAATVNGGLRIATGKRKKKNIELKLNITSPFQKMNVAQSGFSAIFNM